MRHLFLGLFHPFLWPFRVIFYSKISVFFKNIQFLIKKVLLKQIILQKVLIFQFLRFILSRKNPAIELGLTPVYLHGLLLAELWVTREVSTREACGHESPRVTYNSASKRSVYNYFYVTSL